MALHAFERLEFFAGRLLTADDLRCEQDYFRGKLRLHHRFLHGWGIVAGLDVAVDGGSTVVVAPGLALDCAGNELVLAQPERIALAGLIGRHYVTIRYVEVAVAPQPPVDAEFVHSRVREEVRVELADTHPCSGHRGLGPGTPGCGEAHALHLATVDAHDGGWRVVAAKRRRPPRR